MSKKIDGFTTAQGLTAIVALSISIVIAILGLLSQPLMLLIFCSGVLIFSVMYGTKLCRCCNKNCPCNPDLYFWKRIFKRGNHQEEIN